MNEVQVEYCCSQCFKDDYLVSFIRDNGIIAKCFLCGTSRRRALDIKSLKEIFEPLVTLYSPIEDFMPMDMLKVSAGDYPTLAERICEDWEIFDDYDTTEKFLQACCTEYHPKHNPDPDPFDPDCAVDEFEIFFLGEYDKEKYLSELWNDLKTEVWTKNRFFAGREIIGKLASTIENAATMFKAGETFYRARACDKDKSHEKKDMGAPPAASATAGRANPAGIPYLYVASDAETAVSELRPHVGDWLSVGTFKLTRPRRVIDLREFQLGSPFRWGPKLHEVLAMMGFLRKLSDELSRPIGTRHRDHEYLPTQYLCELMKIHGYDGVVYKSGLGNGYNTALFDPSSARCSDVRLVCVSKVDITFESDEV
jgi:RES domain